MVSAARSSATGRTIVAGLVVVIASMPATSPGTAQSYREPTVEVSQSLRGEGGHIEAVIDIKAAPARVWTAMLDCKTSVRIVAGLQSCVVLDRDAEGRWDLREHVVSWGALFPSVRSVFRSDYTPHAKIAFARVEGDLRRLEGMWSLTAIGDGRATRLRYAADVDPGTPLPGVLLRPLIQNDVQKLLRALQCEVERANGC